MTLTCCFDWKACNATDLSPVDKRPWYLTYSMESPSAVAIRSSVVQKEKITLLTLVNSGNSYDIPTSKEKLILFKGRSLELNLFLNFFY